MNERDTILLNNYFNGLLPPAEARQVEQRAVDDPDFGAEFSLRQALEAYPQRAAKRQALQETLRGIEKDFFLEGAADSAAPMTAKVNWARWATAIAAGLVLALGAVWFFSQPTVPEYRQYADHAPLSLTVRGTEDQAVTNAEKAFAAKDYAQALAALESILASDSSNISARLYLGICQIELDRGAAARASLGPISAGQSALRGSANWYIALSYLKEKNMAACKAVLEKIGPGADYAQEAQDLLKKLE